MNETQPQTQTEPQYTCYRCKAEDFFGNEVQLYAGEDICLRCYGDIKAGHAFDEPQADIQQRRTTFTPPDIDIGQLSVQRWRERGWVAPHISDEQLYQALSEQLADARLYLLELHRRQLPLPNWARLYSEFDEQLDNLLDKEDDDDRT